jgi:hypothetical protein
VETIIAQPPGTHLAQFNVATAVDDLDSDRLAGFMAAIRGVNRRADRSPGFVWRLQHEIDAATGIQARNNPRLIVNLSVWATAENLEHFVWGSLHKKVYAKKGKWFAAPQSHHLVMWWVPIGQRPSLREAFDRLDRLDAQGPTADAFGWESLPSVQLWRTQRCA